MLHIKHVHKANFYSKYSIQLHKTSITLRNIQIAIEFVFIETNQLIDSMSNRENENQSQSYTPMVLSPNSSGQSTSTNSSGMCSMDMGRKNFNFSPDQIQCLCEALQQKGDIEKLTVLLCNLPKNELVRPNDSILRYISTPYCS